MTPALPLIAIAILSGACIKTRETRGPDDDLLAPSRQGAATTAGGSTAPTTGGPSEAELALPAEVARWAELTHTLGQDIRRVGTSCPQVAKVMRAFVSSSGRELGELQKEVVRWEKKTVKKEVDRFYRRVFPDLNARIDAGIRCKDDDAARAAYDAFFKIAGLDMR